jgi:hypothetical protein
MSSNNQLCKLRRIDQRTLENVLEMAKSNDMISDTFFDTLTHRAKRTIVKLANVEGMYRAVQQVTVWYEFANLSRFKK